MATLRRDSDGTTRLLARDTLVGRSPGALLKLRSPMASSRHAQLQWSGQRWELRDLGSSNGTRVMGQPLPPGQAAPVGQDMQLEFGGPDERWVMVDESPPSACAVALAGGTLSDGALVLLQDGHIALPSAEDPQLIIHEHPRLGWLVESAAGGVDAADHGQVLTVAGQAFRLDLGAPDPPDRAPARRCC